MNKKTAWFLAGALTYSLVTILLATVVKRIDPGSADSFTFDFKLAQLLLTIGYFEVRVYQVTDVTSKYSFGEYLGFRLVCCLLMPVSALIYFVFSGKAAEELPLIILLTLYKMFDALADVYEGDWQKNERIDISGQCLCIRSLTAAMAFTITLYLTRSIILAGIALFTGSAVVLFIIKRVRKNIGDCSMKPSFKAIPSLFKDTLLLALGAIICTYLLNCASYALDSYAPDYNYIFGALFMPAFVINLAATIFYKPVLTSWSARAEEKDYKGFKSILYKYSALVVVLTLVCMLGAWLIGMPVLSALYATDLTEYKLLLMIILIGGGLNALSILIYHGLVILRCQNKIFLCYLVTLLLTFFVPILMAKKLAMTGAVYAFLIVMLVQTLVFGLLLVVKLKELRRLSFEKNTDS